MPEPVSLIVISATAAASLSGLAAGSLRDSALSVEAHQVGCKTAEIYRHGEASFAVSGALVDARQQLAEVVQETMHSGWDGGTAPPVSAVAHERAVAFLQALPPGFPMPGFAAEPDDGALSLEWSGGHRRVFSVSVGKTSRLAYAGLDSTEKWHGVALFDGSTIPRLILESIRKVAL